MKTRIPPHRKTLHTPDPLDELEMTALSIASRLGELGLEPCTTRRSCDENGMVLDAQHQPSCALSAPDTSDDDATRAREHRIRLRDGHRALYSDPLCDNVNYGSLRHRSALLFKVPVASTLGVAHESMR